MYLNILNNIYVNSLRLMYSDLVLQVYYIQILISLTNHYLVIHNVQCRHKRIHAFRYPILVIGLFKIEQVGRSILIGIFWLSCQQTAFRLALAEVITLLKILVKCNATNQVFFSSLLKILEKFLSAAQGKQQRKL